MVGEARNHRCDVDADRDPGACELSDRREPRAGLSRARLHSAGQIRVERRHRERHVHGARHGQLLQDVDVARDEAALHEDLGLEVEPGRQAQVLVGGPRVAVDAAVLTAAVGVEAGPEGDVGALVARDRGARRVAQVARPGIEPLELGIGLEGQQLEAAGRGLGRAAAAKGGSRAHEPGAYTKK